MVVVRWWRRGGGVDVRIGHLNCACVTRRSVHILFRNLTSKYEQQQGDTAIDCRNSNSLYRGTIREITPLFTDLSQPKRETKICKTQECKHQQKRANSWTIAPARLKWIRWVLLLNMYHYQRNKISTTRAVLYSRCIETSKSCCFWGRGGEESNTSELLWRMRVSGASSASLLLWRKARGSRTIRCNHSLLRIQRCSWNSEIPTTQIRYETIRSPLCYRLAVWSVTCASQNTWDQSTRGQNTRGQNTRGQNTRDQNTRGQNTRGQSTPGQNTRNQNMRGQNTRGQVTRGQNTSGQITRGQITRGQNTRPKHACPKPSASGLRGGKPWWPGGQTLRAQGPTSSPRPSASPTNDPGAGCKMCKILAHFSAWYHGKVAPGHHGIFPIWRLIELPPFSVLFVSVRI